MNRRGFVGLLLAVVFAPSQLFAAKDPGELIVAGQKPSFGRRFPGCNLYLDGRNIMQVCFAFHTGEHWAHCYPTKINRDGKLALADRKAVDDPIPSVKLYGKLEIRKPSKTDLPPLHPTAGPAKPITHRQSRRY